ncbi:MAG: hypothetical protein JST04_15615 [Bdellovibrionales bacterium]|nr:hypothetical protein [Bdellovibrionales bacterium]
MKRTLLSAAAGFFLCSGAFASTLVGEAEIVLVDQTPVGTTSLLGTYETANCNIAGVKLTAKVVAIDSHTDAVVILPNLKWRGELPCPPNYTARLPVELDVPSKADRMMLYIPKEIRFSYPK